MDISKLFLRYNLIRFLGTLNRASNGINPLLVGVCQYIVSPSSGSAMGKEPDKYA